MILEVWGPVISNDIVLKYGQTLASFYALFCGIAHSITSGWLIVLSYQLLFTNCILNMTINESRTDCQAGSPKVLA